MNGNESSACILTELQAAFEFLLQALGNNAVGGAFYFEAVRPALVVGATFDSNIVVVCRTLDPDSSVSRTRPSICLQPCPLIAASRYTISVAMAVQSMRLPAECALRGGKSRFRYLTKPPHHLI